MIFFWKGFIITVFKETSGFLFLNFRGTVCKVAYHSYIFNDCILYFCRQVYRAIMHLVRSIYMLLLILASFTLFLSDGKKSCESEQLQKCISQYVELVRGKQADGSSEQHCFRVQVIGVIGILGYREEPITRSEQLPY